MFRVSVISVAVVIATAVLVSWLYYNKLNMRIFTMKSISYPPPPLKLTLSGLLAPLIASSFNSHNKRNTPKSAKGHTRTLLTAQKYIVGFKRFLATWLLAVFLMGLSFQVYATVCEDVVGESIVDKGYYFPETNRYSNVAGVGSIIANSMGIFLEANARIPAHSVTSPHPLSIRQEIGNVINFKAFYSKEINSLFVETPTEPDIPQGYCPSEFETSFLNPDDVVPPDNGSSSAGVTPPDKGGSSSAGVTPPNNGGSSSAGVTPPNNGGGSSGGGGGSSGGGGLVAIVVIGAAILAMNNRTAIKNSFFLDEKGMGFDLNKDIKFRIASYLPNKHIHVSILSLNVNLNKSIDFGLKSTFVSTGQQRFSASLVHSF